MITNQTLAKMDLLHSLKKKIKGIKARKQELNLLKDQLQTDQDAAQVQFDALELEIIDEIKALL